jgi:phosphoribosylformylglycinamidine synthase
MAITNCLNFGNPYKPEVYWTFSEALGGMGDACRALNTPVTGGNVSLYNENPKGAIFPTPVIGMLGLIEDVENHTMTPGFKNEGDVIYYLGADRKGLGGSEYIKTVHGLTTGDAPELDLDLEVKLQQSVLNLIHSKTVNAAHDVSDGGLSVTLAEMVIHSGLGADVSLKKMSGDLYELLFSEAQSGIVVTVSKERVTDLEKMMSESGIPFHVLGTVSGDSLTINQSINLSVSQLTEVYESVIPKAMEQ